MLLIKLIFVQAVGLGPAVLRRIHAEWVCMRVMLWMADMSPPHGMGRTHVLAAWLCSLPAEPVNLHHPGASPWMDPSLSPSEHHFQTIPLPSVPIVAWEAALLGRKAHAC